MTKKGNEKRRTLETKRTEFFIFEEKGEKITCEILNVKTGDDIYEKRVEVQIEGEDESMFLPTHYSLMARPFEDNIGEVFEITFLGTKKIKKVKEKMMQYLVEFIND